MTALGLGMGLVASQLGNVVQSAVSDDERSEAGGLQFTSQQLGAAVGTALIGAVLITGLIGAFSDNVATDQRVSAGRQQAGRHPPRGQRELRLLGRRAEGSREGGR